MEQVQFSGSMKNIPQCSDQEYVMKFTHQLTRLYWGMCWHAAFVLGIIQKPAEQKETFGFNTLTPPPIVPQLESWKARIFNIASNLEFRRSTNNQQKKMKEELQKMKNEPKLFIKADKSNNYYKVTPEEYSDLLKRDIENKYKRCKEEDGIYKDVEKVTKGDKKIAEKLKLEDRIYKTSERQAYLLLKDHKENFANKKQSRLINPTKTNIGRVTKQILETVRNVIKEKTNLMQWMNTVSVLQWFKKIENKKKYTFIQFDIESFYPSISEKLLTNAINWASSYKHISDDQKEMIFHVRQNFLYNNGKPWVKNGRNFDVPMGSYDSAEVTDIVGLYLLHQLKVLNIPIGLYRDDGLAISDKNPSETEKMKDKIVKIFRKNGLEITIKVNMKIVQFLDVTLDLNTGTYKPFLKQNSTPVYVHVESNHPKKIKENIPKMINDRLCTLSSNEDMFNATKKPYEEALKKSGYKCDLKYEEKDIHEMNKKKKRNRHKRQHWFNPPHSDNLRTNVGEKFINAVEEEFPENHPLHRIFNTNTIRLSYSNMPNMQMKVAMHNAKVYQKKMEELKQNQQNLQQQNQVQPRRGRRRNQQQPQQPQQKKKKVEKPCNCRGGSANCPLGGKCLAEKSIVYSCKVTRLDDFTFETYTGLTEGPFKQRLYGHNADFKKKKQRNRTMLSKYIWYLKDNKIPYQLSWSILGRAKGFNPVTGVCRLCLLEKYFIMYNSKDATLNSRHELFNSCRHKWKHTLGKT